MAPKKEMLMQLFDSAREYNSPFVFIGVCAEGTEEVIVVPEKSFESKEDFYDKAYNDDLVHVMNSKVYIQSFSHGGPEELQNHI